MARHCFCIGTELDQLTGPAYETDWDNIITAVRAVVQREADFTRPIGTTRCRQWQFGGSGLPAGTGNITTQISFSGTSSTTSASTKSSAGSRISRTQRCRIWINGWTQVLTDATTLAVTGNQSLISYYQSIAATLGKPLLFTELGYANASDAASSPATPGFDENGNADGAVEDPALQANLYQAYFDAWKQDGNGSLAGNRGILWNWEPNASSVGPDNGINFSVQGFSRHNRW